VCRRCHYGLDSVFLTEETGVHDRLPVCRFGPCGKGAVLIEIDGSQGEGGGQILRTALSLSLRTGIPFRLVKVRANRDKPGLRPQHLMAVTSAAQLGGAELKGAVVGSRELIFSPRLFGKGLPAGDYRFDIGTAGSAPLVLQTLLPALLAAEGPSTVTISGGTYNAKAPPYDFIARVFAPLLTRLGAGLAVRMHSPGFYPAGGGQIVAEITPCTRLGRLELLDRGSIRARCATAVCARLPESICQREVGTLRAQLGWPADCFRVRTLPRSASPGNVVLLEIESEHITELFSCVGERGVRAEEVAARAAEEALAYLRTDVPVGEHLADQLIMPLALGHGGVYRTTAPSLHTLTQVDIVRRFVPAADITLVEESGGAFRVEIKLPAAVPAAAESRW